eukprot:55723_1
MEIARMLEARNRRQYNETYSSPRKVSEKEQPDVLVRININDPDNLLDGAQIEPEQAEGVKLKVIQEVEQKTKEAPQQSRPQFASPSPSKPSPSKSRSYSTSLSYKAQPLYVPQPEPVVEPRPVYVPITPPEWSKESSKSLPPQTKVSSSSAPQAKVSSSSAPQTKISWSSPPQAKVSSSSAPQTKVLSTSGYYPEASFMLAPETRLDPESSSAINLSTQTSMDVPYMDLQASIPSTTFW